MSTEQPTAAITDERVERAAEAMWNLVASRMDDPDRSPCRNGPVESEPYGKGKIRWRPQRWDESGGAWRTEMLDMAHAALEAAA